MPRPSRRGATFPQLGAQPEPYHQQDRQGNLKYTDAGGPEVVLRFGDNPNFKQPANTVAAATTFAHSIQSAPPEVHESGRLWYPKVHDAVRKGVRGRGFLSGQPDKRLAGAGIVAAVSPNMDWDKNNIGAFDELKSLKPDHWDTIMAARSGSSRAAKASQEEAKSVVKGMSVSSTSIANLQRAGRIVRGEHPDDVIGGPNSPKTYNFMHNIADPSNPHHVTVDGRAYDTLTNMARPWSTGRGISNHHLQRGTSRYEDAASIIANVSAQMGLDPSAGQAISWEHVKYGIEQDNRSRKQGPARRGQPIFDPKTGVPAMHSALPAATKRIDRMKAKAGITHLGPQFPLT